MKTESTLATERVSVKSERVEALQRFCSSHPIVSKALTFHAKFPFEQVQMEVEENEEAKDFYLQVLKAVKFPELLRNAAQELLKTGESIFVFEQNWRPAQFLNPIHVEISLEPTGFGQVEEHVTYKPDHDVRNMVLNTPIDQRVGLLNKMDEYTLRQIELGRYVNLTRSPYMKTVHLRRQPIDEYLVRGQSFFEPILDKLIDQENAYESLKENKSIDPATTVKKIRDIDRLVFDYCFPANSTRIDQEYSRLQHIIKEFLIDEIFKPIAMGKDYTNQMGLLIPTLEFKKISNDEKYISFAKKLREEARLDAIVRTPQDLAQLHENRN